MDTSVPTRTRAPAGGRVLRPGNRRDPRVVAGNGSVDPLWYKDAVIYQTHVRAFQDSNGDGIGDFPGLTSRLDYLQELGVTAVWLLPFYPSPLKDDGYDIADYTNVNPIYGTLRDFKEFLREAHARGLRVITELVINHTSDQHPWFQRARREKPGSKLRDFYVWSDDPERYRETRVIFQDFEPSNWSWDPVAGQYYWHRFYHHQPDLNFDNPAVRQAVFETLEFWMDLGVDAFRLDAIPYLFEREGTHNENLPESHEYLKQLRRHLDSKYQGRMLLAEANQWPEDAAAYFGDGDECHMNFHFPVMPRLYMALQMEDRFPIIDILEQTPAIPDNCQWATFLRNHDELTLEMVTDEERDYMRRMYAADPRARINLGIRRRLAPLMQGDRRRIELMNALLFSLPGTPVVYYGDEIGMGDNFYLGDRNGVRTPMQWSADRNAGFSRANPQQLYFPVITDPEYHFEHINVENQARNPNSQLWWMRRIIALRKQHPAFGRGTLEWVPSTNRKVLSFVRQYGDERILVVANLSRSAQPVDLDLSAFVGMTPVELSSHNALPTVLADRPYSLTLGSYDFFWLGLQPAQTEQATVSSAPEGRGPSLAVVGGWEQVLDGPARRQLEAILPGYLRSRRWFGGKARRIRAARVRGSVPLGTGADRARVCLVEVEYVTGEPDTYMVPLAWASGEQAGLLLAEHAPSVVAHLQVGDGGEQGLLYDAVESRAFGRALLDAIGGRRRARGSAMELAGNPMPEFRALRGEAAAEPSAVRAEQSNSSLVFGDRLILKLYRRLETGENLDVEVGRFLGDRGFEHTPRIAGTLDLTSERGEPVTLGVLQQFVPNQGDAWAFTLDRLTAFWERALTQETGVEPMRLDAAQLLRLAGTGPTPLATDTIDAYLESARLLGQRTAEMHLALARGDEGGDDFRPEGMGVLYQRGLYQGMRNLVGKSWELLADRMGSMPEAVRADVQALLSNRQQVLGHFQAITTTRIDAVRTRTHGDYHLGQVLHTGKDFVIVDFEGEPARALSERRLKRSPLRDVAGMLRSFQYAAYTSAAGLREQGLAATLSEAQLDAWIRFWVAETSGVFLASYLETAGSAPFVPRDREQLRVLLDVFLMEKAIYELAYEANNRPDWLGVPLAGLKQLLGA